MEVGGGGIRRVKWVASWHSICLRLLEGWGNELLPFSGYGGLQNLAV